MTVGVEPIAIYEAEYPLDDLRDYIRAYPQVAAEFLADILADNDFKPYLDGLWDHVNWVCEGNDFNAFEDWRAQ